MQLTRTEIESQIKGIDRMLEDYDSLIQFLWEYEDESIHIFDCKEIIMEMYSPESHDIEDLLKKIKSELEIV